MKQNFMCIMAFTLFSVVVFANESAESNIEMLESTTDSPKYTETAQEFIEIQSNIFMENDGGFLGVGLGYSAFSWQPHYYRYENTNATLTNQDATKISQTAQNPAKNIFALNYEIIAGYKHFFNQYLGARYYASFGANHGTLKQGNFSRVDLISYGANADFLANVYADEMLNFGLFVGIGIGGNTIVGKFGKDLRRSVDGIIVGDPELCGKNCVNVKIQETHFDFAINAGLRLNIGANHGLELAVRVPLLSKSLYAYGAGRSECEKDNNDNTKCKTFNADGTENENGNYIKTWTAYSTNFYAELKPTHSITLRYLYSF